MIGYVIFFVLAAIAVLAAIMVVNTKSPVSSALFLVLTMCSLAGLFVLLGAIFLAALQVIVYAGAIMVLFLFVIMLLNLRKDEYGHDPRHIQKYLGFVLAGIFLVQGILVSSWAMKDFASEPKALIQSGAQVAAGGAAAQAVDYSSASWVAKILFTKYAYPFEVTSILLLAAIVGAVVIARRRNASETESEEM
jgi:NADH-quinone oxidoreductase subunit J